MFATPLTYSCRMKMLRTENNTDKEILAARWQTAHEICSLAACNTAFQDCREGDAYDLGKLFPAASGLRHP
jgi:hypothetical protein